MGDFLLIATLLLLAGVIAVPLATRLGLGSVLGYLLAGIALSPLLARLHVDVTSLQHFAEFGVVMMLFLIGLELEPKKLWQMRGKLIGLGGAQVLLTTLVFAAVALLNGDSWRAALAIGMILAVSSTAVILQTLNERGLMRTEGGQSSFSVLLFQDIAVIPMLAILPLLAAPELAGVIAAGEEGSHGGATEGLLDHLTAWQMGLVTIGAVAFVVFAGSFLVRPVFRFIALAGLRELFTAAALLFVVGIALLMTLVGLSPALGTFLAGVVLANSEYRHEIESDIDPFKGLLLGLFFITVGAGINFTLLAETWTTVAFWTLVLIVTKLAVLFMLGSFSGLREQDRWLFSLALAQAGEFGFVLLMYAVGNQVLGQAQADGLLLVVAMSIFVTPLLFILYEKLIAPRYDKGPGRGEDAIDERSHIIIAGRGRVGGIVDRMLELAGYRATVIDYSSRQVDIVGKFGFRAYFGDATRPGLLHSAGIAEAKLLIVAIDDREATDRLVAWARSNYPDLHVIARAFDRSHVFELWALGCRDIIRETYDSSLRMGRSAFEALGISHDRAVEMTGAFEAMDRKSLRAIADVYDLDIPPHENEPLLKRVRELRDEWDPQLQQQMADILGRDSLND